MCGINGFTWNDPAALAKMDTALRHRGPDDAGSFFRPRISLGHRRLSIIDLSPGGHQPMHSTDGRYTIIYNGELYNYRDLKKELAERGYHFSTSSDTEVLLAALIVWGVDAFEKFHGIFAVALWDDAEQELILARDHLGIKPLYYYCDNAKLIFSSEAKSVLTHAIPHDINLNALNLYARFQYVAGPETMWQNIRKIPAGSWARWKNNNLQIKSYWQPHEGPHITSYTEAVKNVRSTTLSALRDQLVSDVPVGVFLSGGVDSSAVLGMMRSVVGQAPIKTFSVAFQSDLEAEKYNADADLAARTAQFFNTEHHRITVSGRDIADIFEKSIWHMDEPVANPIVPVTSLLSKYARQHVTVALGGDGGDELFGGYDRYWYVQQLTRPLTRLPLQALALLSTDSAFKQKVLAQSAVERYLSFMAQKEKQVSHFLSPAINNAMIAEQTYTPLFAQPWKDTTNQFMAADLRTWLVDESLIRTDRMTMAHALEQRVPLLDWRLVDLAFRIPARFKIDRRSLGKKVFRQAMTPFVPPFILPERKRGFFSPAAKWLRGDLLPLAQELLSPGYCAATADLLNFPALNTLLESHRIMRGYHLPQLWAAMTFQVWAKTFLGPK